MGCIYIFVCLVNFKVYIGQYKGKIPEKRRDDHIRGKGNIPLYNAIRKYGWEYFVFTILYENVPYDQLSDLERKEIARYNCNKNRGGWGYNLTDGGEGTLGWKHSSETLQKKSDQMSGENNPFFGKTLSTEHRQKISDSLSGKNNPNFGKTASTETRQKQSDAKKGKPTWNKKGSSRPEIRGENNPMYGRTGENSPHWGKPLSISHRQKISNTKKGKKNPMYGRPAPNRSPEYERVKWFFFIELANLPIKEKRKRLYQEFEGIVKTRRLYEWTKRWQTELETAI